MIKPRLISVASHKRVYCNTLQAPFERLGDRLLKDSSLTEGTYAREFSHLEWNYNGGRDARA